MGHPRLYFYYFRSFQTIKRINCRIPRDSNYDRQINRQARWPFKTKMAYSLLTEPNIPINTNTLKDAQVFLLIFWCDVRSIVFCSKIRPNFVLELVIQVEKRRVKWTIFSCSYLHRMFRTVAVDLKQIEGLFTRATYVCVFAIAIQTIRRIKFRSCWANAVDLIGSEFWLLGPIQSRNFLCKLMLCYRAM